MTLSRSSRNQMTMSEFLKAELSHRQQRNENYSLRSFARALSLDPSTLSKILKGKRKLGPKSILDIGARLGIPPRKLQKFLSAEKVAESKQLQISDAHYMMLTQDVFGVVADWYHYAILELNEVEGFQPDPKWIAQKLEIRPQEAKDAVDRLVRTGILEVRPDGRWIDRSMGRTSTPSKYSTSSAHQLMQKQILEKAVLAMENVSIDERDQSSMTMAIDSSKLPVVKEKIKKFRRELARYLNTKNSKDKVYHLSISFYPVSK